MFGRLADGYLVTQLNGPHVIFGRGDPCPDDLVTAFLVEGRRPDRRRTTCPGPIADPYVAVAPASAAAFPNVEAALASAETEISYLPEYYYWDGVEPTGTGCPDGGTLGLTGDGTTYDFALDGCAFSRGFAMTGHGRYDSDRDRFELHVRVAGHTDCAVDYVRTGDRTKVTGRCDGRPVSAETDAPARAQGGRERSRPAGESRGVAP